jgi:asparagine synthase (glutamine-hydrolysing)
MDREQKVSQDMIKNMCQVIKHRGPDDEGYYVKGQVGLGMTRLSIIDVAGGHQPIHNEDQSIWIVFNGEIYNFLELREKLIKKGHEFYTHSDTEVIVHLYEDAGEDCVSQLRGMFAFAIWDEKQEKLFMARDRLGQKPLFYCVTGKFIIFASELKSILQDKENSAKIDLSAIHDYLTYGYIPAPKSIYEGIRKLEAASCLRWHKGKISNWRYWQLNFEGNYDLREEEIIERLKDLIRESVKLRLISEVPLGAFLSGGLDSSAIVAYMSQLMNQPVKTFSIDFEDSTFSETKYARQVAKLFGTEHYEFTVKADVIDILPKLMWHFDEPFADSSAIPTYYVSKMAKDYVTVILSGDGGDEVFGGYQRYKSKHLVDYYLKTPAFLRQIVERFVAGKIPETTKRTDFGRRLRYFIAAANTTPELAHANWMHIFSDDMKAELYADGLVEHKHNSSLEFFLDTYKNSTSRDFINKMLYVDSMIYLPDDILVKVDRMNMAVSLEGRAPFLDHKLIEFMATVPAEFKVKGLTSKYILRKSLNGTLPRSILDRGKQGFGVPVGAWFRNELKDFAYDTILSQEAISRDYFNAEAIRGLLNQHTQGTRDWGNQLWSLLCLEIWHKISY